MYSVETKNLSVLIDVNTASIESLLLCGKERCTARLPLFCLCLRDRVGKAIRLDALNAADRVQTSDGASFSGFVDNDGNSLDIKLNVHLCSENDGINWYIDIEQNEKDLFVEWVDFPLVTLPALKNNNANGDGGKILFPYNEGVLIDDWNERADSALKYEEAEYPSKGSFAIFPNMICSQMISYLWENEGIYMGAHDAERGVKGIDFYASESGIVMQMRLWCGIDFGKDYRQGYPIVWKAVSGKWESAAECYREWNDSNLPNGMLKIKENKKLPEWYKDSPLIITYPVRGTHDRDEMTPNRMYPYVNVLPTVKKFKDIVGGRIMVLLMHWEGTAPWAPPYVWPPYGGEDGFFALRDALHKDGDLLGVYCSGFGYTLQSNLVDDYDREKEYVARGLEKGMCASPDGDVWISRICTAQRRGVDICAASPMGKEILREAYMPLFKSGADYAQILDQNHGGGQYFCYSRDHGHPPAPGAWMTAKMQEMLGEWNSEAEGLLFGCESAAAEPFIANLAFSDNRFELNYIIGTPVPLYSYLYHEYVRNFMGNQVSCPFDEHDDETLWYRISYSFAAGDSMTVVLDQDGNPKPRWGWVRSGHIADEKKVLTLVSNLARCYREEANKFLHCGRMTQGVSVECEELILRKTHHCEGQCELPAVISSFWELENGERVCLLVNPTEKEQVCRVGERNVTVEPLNATVISL